MRIFQHVQDIGDLRTALAEAQEVKRDRYQWQYLGKNKTALLIFFNNSLRTRLSTQKAAMNLGMNVIVLDVNQGAWKLETERGVIMDGDKSEHLLEAIPVMATSSVSAVSPASRAAKMITRRKSSTSSFNTAVAPSSSWRVLPCIRCKPLRT